MNHVGEMIQREVSKDWTVLDIGCGIMQAYLNTWPEYPNPNSLRCRSILGLDAYRPYLERVKGHPGVSVMEGNATDLSRFLDDSFDVVMAIDVVEHLPEADAFAAIEAMERIARRKVILVTPSVFADNKDTDSSPYRQFGENELQEHLCLISREWLEQRGYAVRNIRQGINLFAVKGMGDASKLPGFSLTDRFKKSWPVRKSWPLVKRLSQRKQQSSQSG